MTNPKSALNKAVELAGNQSKLAKACDVKPAYIWNWLNRDKRVPAEYVIPVSRATGYQVTPHDLRPDIYPSQTDGIPDEYLKQTA